MVMDENYRDYAGPASGVKFNNQAFPLFIDPNLIKKMIVGENLKGSSADMPVSSHLNFDAQVHSSAGDSPEDLDFSDAVLNYINHILMEEDVEDKACMFQQSAALQAAEKSLYELIGEQYPAPSDCQHVQNLDQSLEIPDGRTLGVLSDYCDCGDTKAFCPDWNSGPNSNRSDGHYDTVNVSQSISHSPYSSSSSSGIIVDGPINSPVSTLKITDIYSDSRTAMQFEKGVQGASKFLSSSQNLIVDLRYNELSRKVQKEVSTSLSVNVEKKNEDFIDVSRGKKNPYSEDMGLQEERSTKQSAVYTESTVRAEMFDTVLLCSQGKNDSALRKALNEVTKSNLQNGHTEGSNGGKGNGKKKGGKGNVVDMRTLLTLCAQAVAADDRRTANEFLKQIRQHATPTGDGMQRLAYYFADGLEARMAGSGTKICTLFINRPISAADILKAYHIHLATCPFKKISNFFANRTIMNVSEKATKLHIIDFGIRYGFQWPCFLQRLSTRPGGPPQLCVTGIDNPCPGFRPSAMVEETGRRLASYAETFKVPFKFNAIAQKWETIRLEDLKIEKDEVLVVNCLYRFRYLLDETVMVNSPRNTVLNLIRKMNPALFVLGVVNGAYNAPFFVTRFREALFHYSSLFDVLDVNIPREIHERMLLERTIFGQEAMNVIACEATERIERPETYKQWQVRNMRAGFEPLPLHKEVVKKARDKVESSYHKDFVIDEDGHWLLQGWKGRMVYALSSWRPAC